MVPFTYQPGTPAAATARRKMQSRAETGGIG
jgi:hypothetical protein